MVKNKKRDWDKIPDLFAYLNIIWLKRAPKGSWFRLKPLTKQSKFGIIQLAALMLAS